MSKAALQGLRRKLVHATLYEALAIAIVALVMLPISGKNLHDTGAFAVLTSAIAMAWNMAFNTAFEAWERRQAQRARTPMRRLAHAIGFESGLVMLTVPVIAWMMNMGWWQALATDLSLVVFFLFYTLAFNALFDHLFGLPDSAR